MAEEDKLSKYGFVSEEELEDKYGFQADLSEEQQRAITKMMGDEGPDVSMAEAAALGGAQGLTFGLSDELAGLVGAVPTKPQERPATFKGTPYPGGPEIDIEKAKEMSPEELMKRYRQARDVARERQKAGEEKYPAVSAVSNIAGGALVPGKLLGETISKTAPLLQRTAQAAKTGAGAGAIAGLGVSEAELATKDPEVQRAVEDVLVGTGLGAGMGAAIPGATDYAKRQAGKLREVLGIIGEETIGPTVEATKRGLKGDLIVGEKARRQIEEEIREFGREIGPEIMQTSKGLAALKGRILERAKRQGVALDKQAVDDYIASIMERQPGSSLKRATREMEDLKETVRTAKEGPEVRRTRQELIPSSRQNIEAIAELKRAEQAATESGVDPDDIDVVFEEVDVPGKLAAVVRQVTRNKEGAPTGFKKLSSKLVDEEDLGPGFREVTEKVREGGRDLTDPTQMEQLRKDIKTKSKLGDEAYKTPEAQRAATEATQRARDLVREAVPVTRTIDERIAAANRAANLLGFKSAQAMDEGKILERLTQIIRRQEGEGATSEKVRTITENLLQELEIANPRLAARIGPRLKDMAEKADIAEVARRQIYIPRPLATLEAYTVKGGNLAGYGIRQVTPESMVQMASKLRQFGGKTAEGLANALERASKKNQRGRNAIMFGIMQNPEYRELMREIQGREEGEDVE